VKKEVVLSIFILSLAIIFLNSISTVNAGEIDSCQTLSSANTVYTLNQTVNSSGTCFTISGENITLDCAGYTINYSVGGGANQYGVYSTQNYTKVWNCTIIDGNISAANSPNQGRHGIFLLDHITGKL